MSISSHSSSTNSPALNAHPDEGNLLGLDEVARVLRTAPQRVQWLVAEYAGSLSGFVNQVPPRFNHEDLATLITLQRLAPLPEEPENHVVQPPSVAVSPPNGTASASENEFAPNSRPSSSPKRHPTETELKNQERSANGWQHPPEENAGGAQTEHTTANPLDKSKGSPPERALPRSADQMLGEMLSTVANSQQSMLNVQDSIREMLGVIAQDNFNLKHENRKLRERMLELERVISEHQRREETRKEMLEGRLRAVESTLSALQQQLAQLVQLQRQRLRKNWFR